MSVLILGGARSGKSRLAETIASRYSSVCYIATAVAIDPEMQSRIKKHKQHRPVSWQTVESPVCIAQSIYRMDSRVDCILIDCLTNWVNNCLFDSYETWAREKTAFLESISAMKSEVLVVSNEVGLGIIPVGELTRQFVDESGLLHQQLAQKIDNVVWVVAGLPNVIKGSLDKGEQNA